MTMGNATTMAEEMLRNLMEDENYDAFEGATIHLTMDGKAVLEYGDGSVLSFSDRIENYDEGYTFVSMVDMLETISALEEFVADEIVNEPDSPDDIVRADIPLYMALEGTVVDDSFFIDLPFLLTDITRNGNPYPCFGSTDCCDEDGDTCLITYTSQLAANIGRRVKVKCAKERFREKRYSTLGEPYYADTDYLHSPTVLAVIEEPETG